MIEGSKALLRAIEAVFDHPVIARRHEHKIRSVRSQLRTDMAHIIERRMRAADCNPDSLAGHGGFEAPAEELEHFHPKADAGLEETLTIAGLEVAPAWR